MSNFFSKKSIIFCIVSFPILIMHSSVNAAVWGLKKTLLFFSKGLSSLGGKKVNDLKEAVKEMDAISLHMPLNDETKNIVNYDLLRSMKTNCIVVNAARGWIINEVDLDKALRENLIFGAGLDVFETEPPKSDNPLLKNDKVFLSPHTAAFTEECMIRMGK